jgi:hypothetical protein
MVNNLVLESMPFESLIRHERIGVDRAACFDVSANVGLQRVLFPIANDRRANFATALQDSHDSSFVFGASLSNPALAFIGVHEASGTANESFVYFHFATVSAKFEERTDLHCQSDAMQHEPCGLLSDAKSAANLVGANTVLAIGDHPNSNKPLVQANRRILKDCPDLDRKLPFGMDALALPLALIFEEHGILALASGAHHDAIRPAYLDHELEAVLRVGEVQDGLLESLWLGTHVVPHKPNYTKGGLICQVYYRLRKC